MLLIALNEAFDRRAIDILLFLGKSTFIECVTGDGLPSYVALAASGLVTIDQHPHTIHGGGRGGEQFQMLYRIRLADKGRMFIDAWKKGDQGAAIGVIPLAGSTTETKPDPVAS